MKLAELSNGSDFVIWIIIIWFAILSIILISGNGSVLIAGYNTASKEEKKKYDEKKLCRITGVGLAATTILISIMVLFETVLPAEFAYISIGILAIIWLGVTIAMKTICKK